MGLGTTATASTSSAAPGGRHDNDFEDYTKICLSPTQDEILSDSAAFLPQNLTGYKSPHLPNGSAMEHLDLHFRLLREGEHLPFNLASCAFLILSDMILPLKQSVQEFFRIGMKNVKNGRFVAVSSKEAPDLCVFENVRLSSISPDARRVCQSFVLIKAFSIFCLHLCVFQGITFDVTFTVSNDRKKTKEFWEVTNQLSVGSLVCTRGDVVHEEREGAGWKEVHDTC